nr:MAG TPA: DIM protein [Caudoviricetes sp.]
MNTEEYEKYLKENFSVDFITLSKAKIPKLTDKEGVNWYPLTYFLKKGLLRTSGSYRFSDTKIQSNMQTLWYKFSYGFPPLLTWFINEKGLKKLLRKMITPSTLDPKKVMEREMALDEACILFNIKRKEKKVIYAKLDLEQLHYRGWVYYCLKTDKEVDINTIWKWCEKCQKYFPNNRRYFGGHKTDAGNIIIHSTCRKCEGKEYVSTNPDLLKMKNKDDLNLIPLYIEKKYYELFKAKVKSSKKYGLSIFSNYVLMVDMIKRIKEDKDFDTGDFYVAFFARVFNLSHEKLKEYLEMDEVEIGEKEPLEKDKKTSKRNYTKEEYIALFKRSFRCVLTEPEITFLPGHAIVAVITKQGLNVICNKKVRIGKAKVFEFSPFIKDAKDTIKEIRRQRGE